MSGRHARLAASAAHRWMPCAGSVGEGGEASIHAATGTFAHDIAAKCLTQGVKPSGFFGLKNTIDGHPVECDQEMVDGVQVYLDAIDEDMQPGDKWWVEMSLHGQLSTVDPDLGGTADYVRYRPAIEELLVADFKYGAGVYVEAEGNPQLKVYALGALLTVLRQARLKVRQVRLMVVQPRYEGAAPVREYVFPAVELLDFAADLREAAERTRLPNPPLVAGEHCKFCPKSRDCSALKSKQTALMAAKFTALDAVPLEDLEAAALDIPLVKERIRALESHMYTLALRGVQFKHHKLVEKDTHRKWKSEGDVIMWAQENAIDPYAPRELLSPAKLEEVVKATAPRGKKKEAVKVLEPFWHNPPGGTALVPITDERPPAKSLVTAASFQALPAPNASTINI